mmetsp:Transcript_32979/g.79760  ORF Transcript_32979/g.79760 Transcript_32979/m.79760 type:complete len:332 (+) Transcript_32979:67-1062(+)
MVASSSTFWRCIAVSFAVAFLTQSLLFATYFHQSASNADKNAVPAVQAFVVDSKSHDTVPIEPSRQLETVMEGVAVSVMLKAPKWFHRRYTVMLHNALANFPPSWKIQVFYNDKWLEKDVLPLHPGLRKLKSGHDRIIWTQIPEKMTRWKPKDIMKSVWLWENMKHENVFLFGGNGALCGNTDVSLDTFLGYDYVGAPWGAYGGKGGDGSSHSFRHRSVMMEILKEHPPDDGDQDYKYFLKHMVKDSTKYKVADRDATVAFGGVSDGTPFLLSGTQPNLNFTTRESILFLCPELKVIFPSLHEPTCFGAHPKPETCRSTICALNDIPPQGC